MNKIENKNSFKKFLSVFAIASIVMLLGVGCLTYIVDPFFQFRVNKDGRYFLSPWLQNGGLARNYDYNTVVLGSSMVQNYDISILKKNNPSVKPVKLSSGGMNNEEMKYLYSLVKKDSVKSFIINFDIPQFNLGFEEVRYPRFLYENKPINKLQYLYGYEACIRFLPIDLILPLYLKSKEQIPVEYVMKTEIDQIGNNSYLNYYDAEHVKDLYLSGQTVSIQRLDGMKERMHSKLASLLENMAIDDHKDIQYTIVLSPYSALYWYHTKESGYYDQFIDFIYHLQQSLKAYNNARLMFFFNMNEITDLNNYSDVTHFSPALTDKVLENIYNPEYELNSSNINNKIHQLDSLVNIFVEQNKDWLPKN